MKKIKLSCEQSLILVAILSISSANAASFDCKKASSYTEKEICADVSLGSLDESLAAKYKYALTLGQEVIKNEQREWLKTLRTCNSPNCIRSAYSNRIRSLDEFIAMSERQQTVMNNSNVNSTVTANQSTSKPNKVEVNESNCKRISEVYERFINQISRTISIPINSIEVIGPIWTQYSGVQCTILIKTPRGNMECDAGEIYTSSKGLSAAGTESGRNSCYTIR